MQSRLADIVRERLMTVRSGFKESELKPYAIALAANGVALLLTRIFIGLSDQLSFLFFAMAVGVSAWFSALETAILLSLIFTPEIAGWDRIDMSTRAGHLAYLRMAVFIGVEFIIGVMVAAV